MYRAITGFHRDERGDWVAELACGHNQHVRHEPPFWQRPWAIEAAGRESRLGTNLDCVRCDRAELPEVASPSGIEATWTGDEMPASLRRPHRLWQGTWAQVIVKRGALRVAVDTVPGIETVLGPGDSTEIPPDVEHTLDPYRCTEFRIAFFAIRRPLFRGVRADGQSPDLGGDPACWRAQVCPACGGMSIDPWHRSSCPGAASPTDSGAGGDG